MDVAEGKDEEGVRREVGQLYKHVAPTEPGYLGSQISINT